MNWKAVLGGIEYLDVLRFEMFGYAFVLIHVERIK